MAPLPSRASEHDGRAFAIAEVFERPRLRGVLHEAFFPAFLAAGIVLIVLAGSARGRVAMSSYGIGLAACLGVSAVYHRGRWTPGVRALLGRIDHSLIFALIAGTYTPVCLLVLSGPLAYAVLGAVWGGGIIGGCLSLLWPTAPAWIEVTPYVALGWVVVIALPELLGGIGWGGASMFGVGGLLYTAGAIVYGIQRPDPFPTVFGYHEVFHTLVVMGAAAQCVAMYIWVLPRTWS